ncbi:MAG: ERF family protein [Casimicrobium sp.]
MEKEMEALGVYRAINAVQSALAKTGISKDRRNSQQGYNFRGIDDVYAAISPLLAEHGLCILPRMIGRTHEERQTAKGGTLFYVTVHAEFDFVAATDGSKHTVATYGEAMDSGDKATNKAMSAAYKYAAFQAFAIPTEGDNDADAQTHEVKARAKEPHPNSGSPSAIEYNALPEGKKATLREYVEKIGIWTEAENYAAAFEWVTSLGLDNDDKTALNALLDSKTRSAFKRIKAAKEPGPDVGDGENYGIGS